MPDLDVDTDPTGALVLNWLEDCMAPLHTILHHTVESHAGIQTHRFSIPADVEDDVVKVVAIGAMARRLMQRPSAFAAWHAALTGC